MLSKEFHMRAFLTCLTMALLAACARAQDPGMQAAQMATQQAMMASQQATQQALSDMQMANQNALNAQQQAIANSQFLQCSVATPKFSVASGTYPSAVTVRINSSRGAAIYYTIDGWTPTTASARYFGPITIASTTTLQAIALSRCAGRSRVGAAVYRLTGVAAAPPQGPGLHSLAASISNAAAAATASGKLLLAEGTAVPLVFASDVNSKTAHVGDKIALTLAQDLKAGDVVVAKKGTPCVATVTEVDTPHVLGRPGEVIFKADYLQAEGTVIKLRGTAAKEGEDEATKAATLMVIPLPLGLLVHGKDAEIQPGAKFTAFVDANAVLPAN